MSSDIKKNFVYLTENLTNLPKILTYLVQESILSEDERERISNKETTLDSNTLLWSLLNRKDWKQKKTVVIEILRKTGNEHCSDVIEKNSSNEPEGENFRLILEKKWWPTEKFLPRAFQHRNREDGKKSLVYHLMEQIKKSKNASTVISQGTAVSGLGGVGKTTTAIWFATHFADLYGHILWIDCGEGSLISSFKELALKLNINTQFGLKSLAKECFSIFENIPCLCVFDNAECYQGNQGIRDVLPKLPNMHCIITSRTTFWGTETGDGNIPQLHLNAFNSNDGVTFLRRHLKQADEKNIEKNLKQLSETLGNLPLALQIAVTTINTKKINLNEYIHRIKTTPAIINAKFDNYEKTINQSMKISMDLIKGHESDHAQMSYNILVIFGYVQPDDVPLKLFEAIENAAKYEVEEAVDLLEEYSLVTTTKGHWGKSVNIHRLLQQVIRHNAKANEKEILRKILSCNEILFIFDYKLISFSYADVEMQNEFPKLRLKFTDGPQLIKLVEELRFSDAVKFSFIIKTYSPSLTADYNYAVCLEKSGEWDKAIEVLRDIYKIMLEDVHSYYEYQWDTKEMESPINKFGLCLDENNKLKLTNTFGLCLEENEKVKLQEVCGLLVLLHLKIGNDEKAMQIITRQNVLVTGNGEDAMDLFIRFLSHSSSISQYKIKTSDDCIWVQLNCLTSGKRLSLVDCSFSEKLPNDLQELNLTGVVFLTLSCYDITDIISSNLKKLKIDNGKDKTKFIFDVNSIEHCMESITLEGLQELNFGSCKWNVNEVTLVGMEISLLAKESEMKINKLILQDVTMHLTTLVNISRSVEEIELKNVKILENVQFNLAVPKLNAHSIEITFHDSHYESDDSELYLDSKFLVNNILNFHAINELTLRDDCTKGGDKMSLDFSLLPAMEKVHLDGMKVSNWEISKCNINQLKLEDMDISDITKTEMIVNKLFLNCTAINSAVLFQMCQDSELVDIQWGKIKFPTKIPSETFQLRATKVTLYGVNFVTLDGEEIENVIVNEIIDILYLKQLNLFSFLRQLTLKMNEAAQLDSLCLIDVELLHFYESQWNVNEMQLRNIPIEKKLKMQISKLIFSSSKIDLSCLPTNLQRIYLEWHCDVVCGKPLNLPELKFLALIGEFSNTLKYFANCKNLMTIQLTRPEFPPDWEILRKVDTLVLHYCPFWLLKLILSKYNTQSVIFNNSKKEISFCDLTVVAELMKKPKSKVSFKRIFWVENNREYFELHENSTPITTKKIIFGNEQVDETKDAFKIEGEAGFLDGWWAELRAL